MRYALRDATVLLDEEAKIVEGAIAGDTHAAIAARISRSRVYVLRTLSDVIDRFHVASLPLLAIELDRRGYISADMSVHCTPQARKRDEA